MAYMTRLVVVVSVSLLSGCLVVAQNLSPAPVPAAVQPTAASAESPAIHEFQKIEDAWDDAINQRDQYALELVLSPLFMDVSASDDFTTRNQQLALLITGEDKTLHLEQRVITVRMLGDIAVANGTYALRRKAGSAQVDEKGVFTPAPLTPSCPRRCTSRSNAPPSRATARIPTNSPRVIASLARRPGGTG